MLRMKPLQQRPHQRALRSSRLARPCVLPREAGSAPSSVSSRTKTERQPPSQLSSIRASFTFQSRSEEHTSELQSLMRISYAVFCLKKTTKSIQITHRTTCTLTTHTNTYR